MKTNFWILCTIFSGLLFSCKPRAVSVTESTNPYLTDSVGESVGITDTGFYFVDDSNVEGLLEVTGELISDNQKMKYCRGIKKDSECSEKLRSEVTQVIDLPLEKNNLVYETFETAYERNPQQKISLGASLNSDIETQKLTYYTKTAIIMPDKIKGIRDNDPYQMAKLTARQMYKAINNYSDATSSAGIKKAQNDNEYFDSINTFLSHESEEPNEKTRIRYMFRDFVTGNNHSDIYTQGMGAGEHYRQQKNISYGISFSSNVMTLDQVFRQALILRGKSKAQHGYLIGVTFKKKNYNFDQAQAIRMIKIDFNKVLDLSNKSRFKEKTITLDLSQYVQNPFQFSLDTHLNTITNISFVEANIWGQKLQSILTEDDYSNALVTSQGYVKEIKEKKTKRWQEFENQISEKQKEAEEALKKDGQESVIPELQKSFTAMKNSLVDEVSGQILAHQYSTISALTNPQNNNPKARITLGVKLDTSGIFPQSRKLYAKIFYVSFNDRNMTQYANAIRNLYSAQIDRHSMRLSPGDSRRLSIAEETTKALYTMIDTIGDEDSDRTINVTGITSVDDSSDLYRHNIFNPADIGNRQKSPHGWLLGRKDIMISDLQRLSSQAKPDEDGYLVAAVFSEDGYKINDGWGWKVNWWVDDRLEALTILKLPRKPKASTEPTACELFGTPYDSEERHYKGVYAEGTFYLTTKGEAKTKMKCTTKIQFKGPEMKSPAIRILDNTSWQTFDTDGYSMGISLQDRWLKANSFNSHKFILVPATRLPTGNR